MDSFFVDKDLENDSSDWMVTYADLVSLLLVFFILLYSISALDVEKFKIALNSIQISLGEYNPKIQNITYHPKNKSAKVNETPAAISRELEALVDIRNFVRYYDLGRNINVSANNGKIIIRISGTILFQSGEAKFNTNAVSVLDGIIKIIDKFHEFNVNIKGYTDNLPISTGIFPSNWELSAIRATTVLRYFIEKGIHAERLTATGYGELLPLYPNYSPENRAKNRRVEFVLEKKG